MLIIGAKGFAKEVLEVLNQVSDTDNVAFYDDVNYELVGNMYGKFPILKSEKEAKSYFSSYDDRYTLGLGGPQLRLLLNNKFKSLGGILTSTISSKANIGAFGNTIGNGVNIMTGVIITSDVIIGEGSLINLNVTVGHDTIIGKYVEISPGVNISGNCSIGDFCNIGTGAVILPKVKIGKNVVIGAGAVVTKSIKDNSLAIGVPAKVVKLLSPIDEY